MTKLHPDKHATREKTYTIDGSPAVLQEWTCSYFTIVNVHFLNSNQEIKSRRYDVMDRGIDCMVHDLIEAGYDVQEVAND